MDLLALKQLGSGVDDASAVSGPHSSPPAVAAGGGSKGSGKSKSKSKSKSWQCPVLMPVARDENGKVVWLYKWMDDLPCAVAEWARCEHIRQREGIVGGPVGERRECKGGSSVCPGGCARMQPLWLDEHGNPKRAAGGGPWRMP